MKIKTNVLFGTLIGLLTGFLLIGFWRNEFDWVSLFALLIIGTLGHFLMAIMDFRKNQKID